MDLLTEGCNILKEHWLLTLLVVFPTLIYWHYLSNFTDLKKLGIPGPAPWPLIGNLWTIVTRSKTLHEYFSDAYKQYGKIFGMYFLKQPTIVIADPEILKAVLVKEFDKFHDVPDGGLEFPEPLASMVISLTGQRWKEVRSIMTPTFTSGKLKGMMYIMNQAGDTLLKKIDTAAEEKQPVDIHHWQQSVTMEVILSAAFGVQSESQNNPDDKVTDYAKRAMTPKEWPNVALMIPFIGKKLGKAIAVSPWGMDANPLLDVAKTIVKQRTGDGASKRDDALQNLLSAQHPEKKGHKLSDDELLAQMVIFMLAGYDTSSNILSLTCYNLALHPEHQEKCFEEIRRICKSDDGVTYDEIKDLQYLEACISETLRLYPPGFILARTVNESCVINGVQFKKGMAVFVPVYSMHRDEEYWSEPNTFKPERFLPENKDAINPFVYLPFGSGPRNCIGMRFAQMEMKSILARMLQKFRLIRGPETPVPIKMEARAVLAPAEPVMIRFEKRD